MTTLKSMFFLFGPIRIGRLGLAIEREGNLRPQRYRATCLWTSYSFAGIRVYWYDKEQP